MIARSGEFIEPRAPLTMNQKVRRGFDCPGCARPDATDGPLGTGKGTADLADWEQADLLVAMGINATPNAPRMITALSDAYRRGMRIVHVNPIVEAASRDTIVPHELLAMAGLDDYRGLELRMVTRRTQHPTEVHDQLRVDILAGRGVEELLTGAKRDGDLAVVAYGDLPDSFQQRHHRAPLDVVADRMPEDLTQRIPVTVV